MSGRGKVSAFVRYKSSKKLLPKILIKRKKSNSKCMKICGNLITTQ